MSQRTSRKLGRSFVLQSVAIMLGIALYLPAASAHAGSTITQPELATIVRCDPTTATGVVGGTNPVDAVVDIYIDDIVGLNAVDIGVSFFDTTIAQVVDQSPNPGVQIEPLYTLLQPPLLGLNTVDNTAGTIQYVATQLGNPAVTGSGPVARITFTGLQAGSFTMTWGVIELSDIDGALIPFTAQPCTITFTNPLAVTLNAFEASAQADHVLVAWETVSETGNAGFNLYRSESPDGLQQPLNMAIIPSHNPGSTQGATYSWQDFDVQPDRVYYYWLEDVSLSGLTTLHGPVSVDFVGPTAVTLSSISASPAAVVALPTMWVLAGAGIALGLSVWKRHAH